MTGCEEFLVILEALKKLNLSSIYVTSKSHMGGGNYILMLLRNYLPIPKMKPVRITSIYDATSKRQNTVETSTYSAEMVAGRLAFEEVMDLRYKLRMLGVPILGATTLNGDNQFVITSCSIPSYNFKKKHHAIAYHRIREAVAAGVVKICHIKNSLNLANAMTKALPGHHHYILWKNHLLKPLQEKGEYQHLPDPGHLLCVPEVSES